MTELTPIERLIAANFVETNRKQDDVLERLIAVERILANMVHKLIPEEAEGNDDPVIYPEGELK